MKAVCPGEGPAALPIGLGLRNFGNPGEERAGLLFGVPNSFQAPWSSAEIRRGGLEELDQLPSTFTHFHIKKNFLVGA